MRMHQLSETHFSTATRARKLTAILAIAVVSIVGSAVAAAAGSSTSAVVTFSVEEIASLQASGVLSRPVILTSPAAGSECSIADGGTYLQYTSLVSDGKTHTVSASIASGGVPNGCALKLEVIGSPADCSGGEPAHGGVLLSGNPRALITGIGNCCTGSNGADGPQVAYRLVVTDASKVVPGETTTVTVAFMLE